MSKTFLFFPVEVGLAHTIRCLSVAEELLKKGHEAIVALPPRKQLLFSSSPVTFVDIDGYSSQESVEGIMEALRHRQFRKHMSDELEIIKDINPHAIVIDFRYTAMISGFISGKKVFAINNSTALPTWYKIPGYPPFEMLRPLYGPIVNRLVQHIKNDIFSQILDDANSLGHNIPYSDIIEKPTYIVPEHPDYFQSQGHNLSITYVPPIEWNGFSSHATPWLQRRTKNMKTIYISFGGTGFDAHKMVEIAQALLNENYQVIVSVGSLISEHEFPTHPQLYVTKFVDPKQIMRHTDLLICHGGYGTITEALRHHVPFISIPFNPEQVMHALRTQELGMSISLARFNLSDIISLYRQDWSTFETIGRRVSSGAVLAGVHKIFQSYDTFQRNIRRHHHLFSQESGAINAATFMIKHVMD